MLREAAGNADHEAYTAIAWGVGLSHEMIEFAGAETVLIGRTQHVQCRLCEALPSLPGSKSHITRKRIASEAGRSHVWPLIESSRLAYGGPHREGEEP